jgi:2-polyprenyl-3-methyl-5-hydroxy-6-metoxy-1,4-benzoquinol methylase
MAEFFSQNQYSKRLCAVCNGAKSRLLFRQNFSRLSDNSSLLSGYNVVVCDQCGFCFADNIPDQTIFDAYYREMSKYEKAERGGEDTPYNQARFQVMADVILPFLTSTQMRIFEIGCANGQLLALLKKNGYENVLGIDPSPVSAEIAREHYGIQVSANTLSDLPIDDQKVDFLIMAGVLEHLQELSPALQQLRKILSDDGSIFITVPDASRYEEGEDAPFQEFSVEHINFFGPDSLENLLKANGFEKVSIQQAIIESNYRTTTPVIHGLFIKSEVLHPTLFQYNNQTESGLKEYIHQSIEADHYIQESINKVVDEGRSIIVWGTGAHTLRLLATSQLGNAQIRAFVDSNPRYQGKKLNAVIILSPQDLKELSEPILISSRIYQEEIENQIRVELNVHNEIIKLYKK